LPQNIGNSLKNVIKATQKTVSKDKLRMLQTIPEINSPNETCVRLPFNPNSDTPIMVKKDEITLITSIQILLLGTVFFINHVKSSIAFS